MSDPKTEAKSSTTEAWRETEYIKLKDLRPETAKEFLPGWEYSENAQDRLRDRRGYKFSKTVRGEVWDLVVDLSDDRVLLFSSSGTSIEPSTRNQIRGVIVHPGKSLSFQRERDGYHEIFKGGMHVIMSSNGDQVILYLGDSEQTTSQQLKT